MKESFEERKNIWDEAEVVMEQKRIQEDELSQCFVRYMETWEPPERKVQSISEKKCGNCTRVAIPRECMWVQVRDSFMSLADSKPKKEE